MTSIPWPTPPAARAPITPTGRPVGTIALAFPTDVTLDASGNLYIDDYSDNRVLEVPASSWHLPGGLDDGRRLLHHRRKLLRHQWLQRRRRHGHRGRSFLTNEGIALDSSGDLLIADTANNAVRFVAAGADGPPSYDANDVYTLAGTGTAGTGGDSAQATGSELDAPQGVVFDAAGDEYIADTDANRVQEIAASDRTQWGVTMSAGDVYTIAGSASGTSGFSGDGAAATSSKLAAPMALAFDSGGDLYIADHNNGVVREIAATTHSQWGQSMTAGDIYTVLGQASFGDSPNGTAMTSAEFDGITGLAVDSAGDLYIADSGNSRVLEVPVSSGTKWGAISETANEIFTVAGNGTAGHTGDGAVATSAELSNPYGLAIDANGDLYIADASNDRVQEVAASTGSQWGQSMTADDIYTVADTSSGSGTNYADGAAMGTIALAFPTDVTLDASGNLYIDDYSDNRVLEVPASSGTYRGVSMTADDSYTIAGNSSGTSGYSGDGGTATSAKLSNEEGIALDSSGDLLIADTANNAVRFVAAGADGPETVTTPSGYTLAMSKTTGSTTTYLYTHTVGSSDTSVTLDYSSSAPKDAVLGVYRGINTTSPIDTLASAATSSATSVTAPALTTTNAGDELVVVAGAGQLGGATTWTAPSGMAIESKDTSLSSLATMLADEVGPASAGSTSSPTATSSQNGQLIAILVALVPSTVSTTTAYDPNDEPTIVTDAVGNATLTCYDGDGNVAETVPPVGVAANSLTAASCSTSYPTDYGDRLATDATTTAYRRAGQEDDGHDARASRPERLRDEHRRLRSGRTAHVDHCATDEQRRWSPQRRDRLHLRRRQRVVDDHDRGGNCHRGDGEFLLRPQRREDRHRARRREHLGGRRLLEFLPLHHVLVLPDHLFPRQPRRGRNPERTGDDVGGVWSGDDDHVRPCRKCPERRESRQCDGDEHVHAARPGLGHELLGLHAFGVLHL